MAHFAKVCDGKVIRVIVAELDFFDTFVDNSPGQWLQTSINTFEGVHYNPETGMPSEDQSKALRYNYASIGGNYDEEADAFYPASPYPSWTLDKQKFKWNPPTPLPEDGNLYDWDEVNKVWVLVDE